MHRLEAREGSSQVTTRSVAAALRLQHLDVYELPAWQKAGLALLNSFPAALIRVTELNYSVSGLDHTLAHTVRTADLVRESLAHYEGLEGPFEAVVIGAAGQGAAHLAVALGAPFLPQPFVLGFRGGGSKADDARAAQRSGQALSELILANNPDVCIVNHFDPIHDGWFTPYITHARLKLIELHEEYAAFVRSRLKPGGALVFLDCTAPWPQFRIGPRLTFQIGGWGGIAPSEYLDGSPRIDAMKAAQGSPHRGGWRVDFPLEQQPESEWGTAPGLRESVRAFAEREGYRFVPVTAVEPEQLGELAFLAHARLYEKEGREPAGTLVEMFTRTDPAAARLAALLPCWIIWNTTESLAFLQRMLPRFPQNKPILFTPLANFVVTPDLVPWAQWAATFAGRQWQALGWNPDRWPSDAPAMWRPTEALARYCEAHPNPMRATLTIDELVDCTKQINIPSPDGASPTKPPSGEVEERSRRPRYCEG
ncbi:MAG: hypothetical protein HY679_07370 [Chloroflexi bacterium]|nr:hypothetical protein [Chloroflexota bacterium]